MEQKSSKGLKVVSFNLHGFNQGFAAIEDLIDHSNPDICLWQEHWLTPDNLHKFDVFSNYFTFGCSTMVKTVESGILRGRPFGGIITMIRKQFA